MEQEDVRAQYQAHGALVYRRCQRVLQDDDEAWDVCQEAFIRLMQTPASFRAADSLPWLYRVATNLCIDRLRKKKRISLSIAWEDVVGQELNEESALVRDMLSKLWQHLAPEEQSMLLLRYVDELSLEEMEEVCELTRKTISKRLKMLQKKARNILASQNAP